MKFFCIADEDTVRGFRLAGVAGQVALTPDESLAAFEGALRQPDYAIIILTGSVAAGIRARVEAVRLGMDYPLIVEIPGPEGPTAEYKTLRSFVQEAVGIEVGQSEGT